MKIAIIGSGISGISAAYNLGAEHEIVIYEANSQIGGHTNTVSVDDELGYTWNVDTGFIVFNDRNYPGFSKFLTELGVATQKTSMSFSFSDYSKNMGYAGTLKGVSSTLTSRNLNNIKTLINIYKYSKKLRQIPMSSLREDCSVIDFLEKSGCPEGVIANYFKPIASAIWSCNQTEVEKIPVSTYATFFENHGLLQLTNRPKWYSVRGGSVTYLNAFKNYFPGLIRTGEEVRKVTETKNRVCVTTMKGVSENYDYAIIATHADQALKIASDVPKEKARILKSIRYSTNKIYLHTDLALMPIEKKIWASWNVIREESSNSTGHTYTTYNMNLLQSIDSKTRFLVTVNPEEPPNASNTLYETRFTHPILSHTEQSKSKIIPILNKAGRIKFCGAYTGYGFHEDGYKSGKEVSDLIRFETSRGSSE